MNIYDLPDELIPAIADNVAGCVALAGACRRFRDALQDVQYPMEFPYWTIATFANAASARAVYAPGFMSARGYLPVSPAYIRRTLPIRAWPRATDPIKPPQSPLPERFQVLLLFPSGQDNISARSFNNNIAAFTSPKFAAFSPYV
jgi:hypothetical protein